MWEKMAAASSSKYVMQGTASSGGLVDSMTASLPECQRRHGNDRDARQRSEGGREAGREGGRRSSEGERGRQDGDESCEESKRLDSGDSGGGGGGGSGGSIKPGDFNWGEILGEGSYSRVRRATRRATGEVFISRTWAPRVCMHALVHGMGIWVSHV